uniref:dolichol kinase n=1 Tax=Ganoderma boninense TaxID=34458 RepID=A0A5K1JUU6_9APHY|nr:Histidine kinase (EC [Ganoderma boninense]
MSAANPPKDPVPPGWLVEAPMALPNTLNPITPLEALLLSRRYLVSQATFCATILLVHVSASWVTEARHRRKLVVPEGEVSSVPRKEGRRTYLYILFAVSVTLWILCVRIAMKEAKLGIWQSMSYFEVVASAMFFQFSLYACVRVAHHGLTFGELALVAFGATVLFMELVNLTKAKIALIPGSLLTGFLLSPLLYLSRHIAQRPVRRLRYPQEKQKHRRLLALGFYSGTLLIVGGLIGLWTRWCLGGRDPWVYLIFWMLEGKNKWTRPALVAYWALLISLSVAGWTRQLARGKRWRQWNVRGSMQTANGTGAETLSAPTSPRYGMMPGQSGYGVTTTSQSAPQQSASVGAGGPTELSDSASVAPGEGIAGYGIRLPNLPNLPNLPDIPNANLANVATDLLDAADKRVPTLSVNARRKFFHALAVVMFVPGIAVDVTGAFALFTFAEYVRYFALYPFGAAVHLFMNEFLDSKDGGTAILSHFYLLTGCANSVWFEGSNGKRSAGAAGMAG